MLVLGAERAPLPGPMDTDLALTAEPACHLPRAVERRLQKLLVDQPHQAQVQRALARARVVERRAGDRHQAALPCDADPWVVGIDHLDSPAAAHRPKAFDKKSRSMTSSPIFARSSLTSVSREASCRSWFPEKPASTSSSSWQSGSDAHRSGPPAPPSSLPREAPPTRPSPSAQQDNSASSVAFQTPSPWPGSHLSKLSQFRGPPLGGRACLVRLSVKSNIDSTATDHEARDFLIATVV